ncbi:hypothetical protein Elgi_37840 [Paenibacillus elgii]|nr:hypothetical protein Elgi_37840 [Paenibacillus elgii]
MKGDLTEEELKVQPEGAIVSMGCRKCEGFENTRDMRMLGFVNSVEMKSRMNR